MVETNARVPEVAIVIGTLDRCEIVGRAIQSILAQNVSADRYEIVVVDNRSRDRTREVVEKIAAGASNVRYVYEPRLGLSAARNRGTAETRAPVVAFFDDDATAEPGWLAAMLKILGDHPEAGAAGGPIEVGWPFPKPDWMPRDLQGYYGACNYGEKRSFLAFPQYPYGSNMFIRREHLLAVGGFSEDVGAKGQNIMQGDELDMFQHLYQRGVRVAYEPRALVRHWVPVERLTRKWLLRRAYKHGFSNTRLASTREGATRGTWLRLLGRACGKSAVAAFSSASGFVGSADNAVVTSRFASMLYWAGVARGARDGIFHGAAPPPPLS